MPEANGAEAAMIGAPTNGKRFSWARRAARACLDPLLKLATRAPTRVYVPFGQGHLPYAISQALRQPRLLAWLGMDRLASVFSA